MKKNVILWIRHNIPKRENYIRKHRLASGLTVGDHFECYSWEGIDANWPWLITIGNHVGISHHVIILAHDASPSWVDCGTKLGRVDIGNNVFIGAGVTILCNTKIGDNVVIGAGSVVSGKLESGYVYAGIPAKKICSIEEYKKKNEERRSKSFDFSAIRPWYEWEHASEEEKKKMKEILSDGPGYI